MQAVRLAARKANGLSAVTNSNTPPCSQKPGHLADALEVASLTHPTSVNQSPSPIDPVLDISLESIYFPLPQPLSNTHLHLSFLDNWMTSYLVSCNTLASF